MKFADTDISKNYGTNFIEVDTNYDIVIITQKNSINIF